MPCYRPHLAQQTYSRLTRTWSRPRIIKPLPDRDSDGSRHYPPQLVRGEAWAIPQADCPYERIRPISLPCGLCFGCRCDNARMWSLRMMHERRYHTDAWFITLTYSPQHMPANGDLNYRHLELFFKNARHHFQDGDVPFKYFACGEYGDQSLRPHYHFAAFSFTIPDLRRLFRTPGGDWYYTSELLSSVWKYGHVIVGKLEWDSAAYIARYVTKKMHGSNIRYLDTFDPDTGEVDHYSIERAFQSKGLGLSWYLDNEDEIWRLDACLFKNEYLVLPPRYYFKKLQERNPELALIVKEARSQNREHLFLDNSRDKELLYAMEAKRLQMQTLKRSFL